MEKIIKSFIHKNVRYFLPTEGDNVARADDSRKDMQAIARWLVVDSPVRATSSEYVAPGTEPLIEFV